MAKLKIFRDKINEVLDRYPDADFMVGVPGIDDVAFSINEHINLSNTDNRILHLVAHPSPEQLIGHMQSLKDNGRDRTKDN